MAGMITFLDVSSMNSCKKAVAPVIHQSKTVFSEDGPNTGSTPVVVVDVAAGEAAYHGGQVIAKGGCYDVLVEFNALEGNTCDPCDAETITLVPFSVIVPANSAFPLPEAFWQDLQLTLVDGDGNPVDVVGPADETVHVYSCYTPECPECAVLAI